jgi:hypothetical protein
LWSNGWCHHGLSFLLIMVFCYLIHFEQQVLNTTKLKPACWYRYVDKSLPPVSKVQFYQHIFTLPKPSDCKNPGEVQSKKHHHVKWPYQYRY